MKEDCCLDKMQIKNIRSLGDTGLVSLSKVNLLVGENSSGKSTFLRIFPLIKQSISKKTNGPILWAGDVDDYVDFGSFGETLSNDGSTDMTLSFQFEQTPHLISRFRLRSPSKNLFKKFYNIKLANNITYSITISRHGFKEYISELYISLNRNSFRILFAENGQTDSISVNQEVINFNWRKTRNSLFYFFEMPNDSIFGFHLPDTIEDIILDADSYFVKKELHSDKIETDQLLSILNSDFPNQTSLIGELFCKNIPIEQMKDVIKDISRYNRPEQNQCGLIYDQLILMDASIQKQWIAKFMTVYLYNIFPDIDNYLRSYFRQVHYIAPLRATAERYYRFRNLAVDEVDYQGKNLAFFLSGLTKGDLLNFQSWTLRHFGFKIIVDKTEGHVSIKVALQSGGPSINMSDTGFGYSQILPIITQLWHLSTTEKLGTMSSVPLVIAIEQPELHLHPALQAKMVEAFIACIELAVSNNKHVQFILETHSETIVNHFGRMIARGRLESEDISVLLFERDSKTKKR